jgi:hypothetical protein
MHVNDRHPCDLFKAWRTGAASCSDLLAATLSWSHARDPPGSRLPADDKCMILTLVHSACDFIPLCVHSYLCICACFWVLSAHLKSSLNKILNVSSWFSSSWCWNGHLRALPQSMTSTIVYSPPPFVLSIVLSCVSIVLLFMFVCLCMFFISTAMKVSGKLRSMSCLRAFNVVSVKKCCLELLIF